MTPVTRRDLVKIALARGKTERWVRWAVDSALIPKAHPTGRGQGAGQDWFYPSGTDKALIAMSRLQKLGYRGGQLHFGLWWIGRMPLSSRAIEYVGRLVREDRELISKAVEGWKARDLLYQQEVPGVSAAEAVSPTTQQAFGVALGARLIAAERFKKEFQALTKIIAPGSFHQISSDDIEALQIVISSFLVGVSPAIFKRSSEQVYKIFRSIAESSDQGSDPSIEAFRELGSVDGFETMVNQIDDAGKELFDQARKTIRANTASLKMIRQLRIREEQRQRNMSKRRLARRGFWSHPAVAMRALTVGVGVGSIAFFEALDLDSAMILGL